MQQNDLPFEFHGLLNFASQPILRLFAAFQCARSQQQQKIGACCNLAQNNLAELPGVNIFKVQENVNSVYSQILKHAASMVRACVASVANKYAFALHSANLLVP